MQIDCLRCKHFETLNAPVAKRDVDGKWIPLNTKRPDSWSVGPANPADPTKGLCPSCAPAWLALQERFLTDDPIEEVDLRRQRKVAIVIDHPIPISVGTLLNRDIPEPADALPPPSVPVSAVLIELPQTVLLPEVAAVAMRHYAPAHERTVTKAPTRQTLEAAPHLHATTMIAATPPATTSPIVSNAQTSRIGAAPIQRVMSAPISQVRPTMANAHLSPVKVSTLVMQTQAVKITANRVGSVPATRIQAIATIAQPINAVPTSTLQGARHAAAPINSGGGMVTVSAPVPIRQDARQQGCVTISEPVPIEPRPDLISNTVK